MYADDNAKPEHFSIQISDLATEPTRENWKIITAAVRANEPGLNPAEIHEILLADGHQIPFGEIVGAMAGF